MTDEVYDAGMKVRREVLGDAHVDRAIERTTEFTAPFQEFITRYAWGGGVDAARGSTAAPAARSRCRC